MSADDQKGAAPPAVEALVEALRGEGDAEAGEFTLDRAVALEKLRRFQLADPRAYVLELVQAASLKGATWIHFDVDTDDMRMRFDGSPFTARELDEVYASAFRSDPDAGVRGLRQLALGLNSALALKPRWIRVVSAGETERVTLEISGGRHDVTSQEVVREDGDGDGDDEAVEKKDQRDDKKRDDKTNDESAHEPARVATTTIHLKARLKPQLLRRFVRSLRRTLPEERILRRRARYSTLDIQLNGRTIARGLEHPDGVAHVKLEDEGLQVVCCLVPGYDPPRVHWIKNGVLVSTTELKGSGSEGFVALVSAVGLRTDVSQTNIVQDEIYYDALQKVDRGRNKLKMRSSAQKAQADERYDATARELEAFYDGAASRYEVLHRVGERAYQVGYALILINIFAVALLPTLAEEHWRWVLVPLTLLVGAFAAPSICGRLARATLESARDRFNRKFPRSNRSRRLARRALEKREDDWNGTLADAMQRRR